MEQLLLRDSIKILKKLRLKFHDNLEPKESELLDEVITKLVIAQQTNRNIDAEKILEVLGKIIEKIPAIVELIRVLLRSSQ